MADTAARLEDRKVTGDIRVLGDFVGIRCAGVHRDREKARFVSEAATAGVYGGSVPVVCEECAALLSYAERRRVACPKEPKPFCSACDTHCYRPDMREAIREVMRYSGPRSIFRGHALAALRHLLQTRRTRGHASGDAVEREERT